MKKDKGSNYQKVGEKIQDKGFGAKNDSSISSASHCGIVKIMSLETHRDCIIMSKWKETVLMDGSKSLHRAVLYCCSFKSFVT